jgi:hypothetical protein
MVLMHQLECLVIASKPDGLFEPAARVGQNAMMDIGEITFSAEGRITTQPPIFQRRA